MLKHNAFVRLCRARDALSEVTERQLPIEEMARLACYSPYHFIRQFEALFGETPHQLRIQARIARAKHLLATDHCSVTEICMQLGFASLGSFSHLFSRRVGLSPMQYRERVRPLIQVPGLLPPELIPGCLTLMYGARIHRFAIFEKPAGTVLAD